MIQYRVIELDTNLPERYNENLLKKLQLTMDENDNVMLNLRLIQTGGLMMQKLNIKASGLFYCSFYRLFTKI